MSQVCVCVSTCVHMHLCMCLCEYVCVSVHVELPVSSKFIQPAEVHDSVSPPLSSIQTLGSAACVTESGVIVSRNANRARNRMTRLSCQLLSPGVYSTPIFILGCE